MRRFATIFAVVLVLTSGSACTRIAVYVEHDPTVSFADLSTYEWAGPTKRSDDQILEARIRKAVETELAARGFEQQTEGTADFSVAYTAAVDETLQSMTIDRYAGYTQSTYLTRAGTSRDYPRQTASRTTVVYEYTQGSLILDISLPKTKRLIWRAYSRAIIDPQESQAKRDKTLSEAVRLMLKEFPPY